MLSTLGAGQAFRGDFEWSSDSRLLHYLGEHQQPETYDLHVVDVSGAAPGEPVLVTGGILPTGNVEFQTFDPSSSWLYYVAQQESEDAQMYRVDVSGPEPGTPQRVSGGTGRLSGEIIPSLDWSRVIYTLSYPADGTVLDLVDVSGDEPGDAIRLNAPLAEGASVSYGPDFSLDGSVVIYQQGASGPDEPTAVELVDLASLEVFHVSDDAQGVFPIVD